MQRGMAELHLITLTGADQAPYLDAVAQLRATVFAEWPYLYAAPAGASFTPTPGTALVLALDGDRAVGAATCQPMEEASAPVRAAGLDPATHCYFGESVLLPEYRGRGAGVRFFAAREAQARAMGLTHAAFCAVVRNPNDPRQPPGYQPLDNFWRRRGYTPQPGISAIMHWPEPVDGGRATPHSLAFWTRAL